jgi:hypothetical protein
MSIVSVHGPYTFGSKAVTEVGPAMATVNPTNGLIWTFKLDQASTRTASLAWTFPTGTPASATGPGPHTVTYAGAGSKANTMVATGAGEGVNPYPAAGTTNLPVTAVAGSGGAGMSLLSAPGGDEGGEEPPPEENGEYDPGEYTIPEVEAYVDAYPDQTEDVLDAEVAGKNRSTLVAWLEARLPE